MRLIIMKFNKREINLQALKVFYSLHGFGLTMLFLYFKPC